MCWSAYEAQYAGENQNKLYPSTHYRELAGSSSIKLEQQDTGAESNVHPAVYRIRQTTRCLAESGKDRAADADKAG